MRALWTAFVAATVLASPVTRASTTSESRPQNVALFGVLGAGTPVGHLGGLTEWRLRDGLTLDVGLGVALWSRVPRGDYGFAAAQWSVMPRLRVLRGSPDITIGLGVGGGRHRSIVSDNPVFDQCIRDYCPMVTREWAHAVRANADVAFEWIADNGFAARLFAGVGYALNDPDECRVTYPGMNDPFGDRCDRGWQGYGRIYLGAALGGAF